MKTIENLMWVYETNKQVVKNTQIAMDNIEVVSQVKWIDEQSLKVFEKHVEFALESQNTSQRICFEVCDAIRSLVNNK